MPSKTIKVAILDDHAIQLEGLQAIISLEEEIEIVAVAQTWENFWPQIREREVDILILDIHLTRKDETAGVDGIEIAAYLKDHKPLSKIILMTFDTNASQIERAKETDIEGYILKEETSKELIKAISCIATTDRTYYSPQVIDILFKGQKKKKEIPSFTSREKEILTFIAKGHNVPQIVGLTNRSTSVINTHKKNVMKKLGIRNVEALVVWALKHGYNQSLVF